MSDKDELQNLYIFTIRERNGAQEYTFDEYVQAKTEAAAQAYAEQYLRDFYREGEWEDEDEDESEDGPDISLSPGENLCIWSPDGTRVAELRGLRLAEADDFAIRYADAETSEGFLLLPTAFERKEIP